MLQNASYMFVFKKETKQNDYEKKKKVSPGKSRTWDLRHVKRTHYLLHHATIAKDWMSNLTSLCPQDKFFIQGGAENADIWRNEFNKRSPLSTTVIPRLCVAFS